MTVFGGEADRKRIEEMDKLADEKIEQCYGSFCNALSGRIDRLKAKECVKNCPLFQSCLVVTQMLAFVKRLGEGEDWRR